MSSQIFPTHIEEIDRNILIYLDDNILDDLIYSNIFWALTTNQEFWRLRIMHYFGFKTMDRKLPRLTYHQYYNQLRYNNLPSEENLVRNNDYSLILKRLDYYSKIEWGLVQAAVEQGNILMLQFIKDTLFSRIDLRGFQWLDRMAGTSGNIEVIRWLDTRD